MHWKKSKPFVHPYLVYGRDAFSEYREHRNLRSYSYIIRDNIWLWFAHPLSFRPQQAAQSWLDLQPILLLIECWLLWKVSGGLLTSMGREIITLQVMFIIPKPSCLGCGMLIEIRLVKQVIKVSLISIPPILPIDNPLFILRMTDLSFLSWCSSKLNKAESIFHTFIVHRINLSRFS